MTIWPSITHCQLLLSALPRFLNHDERPPFSDALMRTDPFSKQMGILAQIMVCRQNMGKSPSDKAKQLLPHLKQLRSEVAAITHEEFAAYKKQVLDRFDEVITTLETVKP
jgi:hypothetical protein